MKIVIAGVPYSPNLGDGLISMLVTDVLRRQNRDIELDSIDLAGRASLAPNSDVGGGSPVRAAMLRLHRVGPTSLLDWAYCQAKTRTGAATVREWSAKLDGADVVIIGPGQLLSSRTANFPAKLTMLADALDRCVDRPVVKLLGVGADATGSPAARRALSAALERLEIDAAVFRDQRSRDHVDQLVRLPIDRTRVAPDIAVCSSSNAGEESRHDAMADAIYVDAVDLGTYDDVGGAADGHDAYRRAIEVLLLETGASEVAIGSNGLVEDQAAARRLADVCTDLASSVYVVDSPSDPMEIVERAGRSRGTVGVRLHAVLPALATGRPVVAPILSPKAEMVIAQAYGERPNASRLIVAGVSEREKATTEIEEAVQWLTAA